MRLLIALLVDAVLQSLLFVGIAAIHLIHARRYRPEKSAALKTPPRHVPDWERNESASRRTELDQLRKAIEDRSRR